MLAHTRKWKHDFKTSSKENNESWYDLIEDWELIDASFTQQYGIRLSRDDMSWYEFQTKLTMLNEKTALGQIISIRSENDPEMLKHFNADQKRIRNEYRQKKAKETTKDDDSYKLAMESFKQMFKSMAKNK